MTTLLEQSAREIDEIKSAIRSIIDKASEEERDLTEMERERITTLTEAGEKKKSQAEFLHEQVVSERSWAKLRNDIEATKGDPIGARTTPNSIVPAGSMELRSWGESFIDSPAFQNYPGGGTSQRITVPMDLERRAAITTATVPQVPYQYSPPAYTFDSPLLNVVGKITTGGNAVSWVQWTPNPQAPASLVLEGELKPEAAMTATPMSASLATYAHHKEITRQALEDLPQIRSIVEGRLRQGIVVALEDAIIAALVAAVLPAVTGSTLLGSIRVGISTVQSAGFARPNAIVVNPADAADIDIAMLAGTMNGAVMNGSYWGLPVIPSNDVAAGTAYVGDFGTGVQLFNRGQTDVYLSDSHADYFLRNILSLLAETRALATVPEPLALAECTVVTIP
jgi:HK97 family phage major capsid protein